MAERTRQIGTKMPDVPSPDFVGGLAEVWSGVSYYGLSSGLRQGVLANRCAPHQPHLPHSAFLFLSETPKTAILLAF
jgi:hypothetical protein